MESLTVSHMPHLSLFSRAKDTVDLCQPVSLKNMFKLTQIMGVQFVHSLLFHIICRIILTELPHVEGEGDDGGVTSQLDSCQAAGPHQGRQFQQGRFSKC